MDKEIQQRAKFDKIRYSNCWEDPILLLEALNIKEDSKCLSIASGLDNSLSLLTKNPALVLAVDLSIPQIACSELKKQAIKNLDYETFLGFLGFKPQNNRMEVYRSIKEKLSSQSQYYLDNNLKIVLSGIIHKGKFEQYFQIFAQKILPLIHNQKNLSEFFLPKSINAQKIFYYKTFNNWKFKLLFKVFFSRFVLGRLGRDKEFFKYVSTKQISDNIKKRADYALGEVCAWNNPFLNYILLNNFDFSLPHYAKKENFDTIKQNIDSLRIERGLINQIPYQIKEKFDCFNLSDIFEYMDLELFIKVSKDFLGICNKNARFCYWNMLVDRQMSKILPQNFYFEQDLSKKLHSKDRAFFYKAFIVEGVKNV